MNENLIPGLAGPTSPNQSFQLTPEKLTGLLGLLGGPAGGIIGGGVSSLLSAFSSLIGGDGGLKKRRREAQAAFRDLLGSNIDQNFLNQSSTQFQRANLPTLNKLFTRSAKRVGLDSGLGQGAALNQFSDLLARFNSQNLINERNVVAQNKRFGAQGLASLVG